MGLIKLAVNAASPATKAPSSPVARINKKLLSVLKISSEIRLAKMWPLFVLIQKLRPAHRINNAMKPERKESQGC